YYGSWAINRPGIGSFGTSDIDPSLCTHIYYSFIGLNNATQDVEILDPALDVNRGGFRNLTNLKARYPRVKFLVAMGGWSQGSYAYSVVAASASKRATFIQQIIDFIHNYGFDGLDLDWEYPAQRDSAFGGADKENLITLLQEVKAAFEPLGLLITVAVQPSPSYIDDAYDVPALSNAVDLINFMSYDLHGSWDGSTGVNAPLHDQKIQQGWAEAYDQNYESPFACSGNQWVGYDNVRSISAKVNFVCSKGLGGVMNWAIDEDDFDGNFGPRYPLLRAMNAVKRCRN
ncbi:endochitinase-like, partial [Agrilus planipennis]|uniref:Endochitinase-like n=1 Tax=Agrilus planipennis TaxID=224129 RepID=A0A7F5RH56_AGRPL